MGMNPGAKEVFLFSPIRAQQFRLRQHGLGRLVLQVGRVPVLPENALHHHLDRRTGALPHRPVNRHAFANLRYQFGGNHLEFIIAHRLHRALIGCQRVVEGNLVVIQPEIDTPLRGPVHFLRQLDQFVDRVAMARLW